jgi:hypothetical protein
MRFRLFDKLASKNVETAVIRSTYAAKASGLPAYTPLHLDSPNPTTTMRQHPEDAVRFWGTGSTAF